jgi:WD40 repeat protein
MSMLLIPEHTLLRSIGRGSYGEVWLARNAFGNYRAIKIVTRGQFKTAKPFDRELSGIRKFEPISRSHPGFIPILQVGSDPGREYFYAVMELADDASGVAFDPETYEPRALRSQRLPISECVKIGISLGETLQYLHQNGLIHRDVKPSNILFIRGSPKLADVGMVAALDDTFSFVGTEGFIPPEGPGTIQSDIYSLGKVLYEIGSGRDRMDFPAYPDPSLFPEWDRFLELNEVLVKACHTDRKKRYQTADELVSDLKALSVGKSVLRLRRLEHQAFLAKRIAFACAIVFVLAVLIFFPIYQQIRFHREERARQTGRNIAFGVESLDRGEYIGALPFLLRGLELDTPKRKETHLVRLSSVINQNPQITCMAVEKSAVTHVEFSSDQSQLLTATLDGDAVVHGLTDGSPVITVHHPRLRQACFGPHGRGIVTAGEDHSIRIWEADGTLSRNVATPNAIFALAVSTSGNLIAAGESDGSVLVWDLSKNIERFTAKHAGAVESVAFSHDGRFLASGSEDGTCVVWDSESGERVQGPLKHESWVTGVAFSPDGSRLATASMDRKVRVWDRETGRELVPALRHPDGVRSVSFSPDGEYLLTGSYDWAARLYNAKKGELIAPVLPQSGRVMDAQFDSDCSRIAIGCWDGSVRVYDLTTIRRPINRGVAVCSPDLSQFTSEQGQAVEFKDTVTGNTIGRATLPEVSRCLGITPDTDGTFGVFVGQKGRYIGESSGTVTEIPKNLGVFESYSSNGKLIGLQKAEDVAVINRSGALLCQIPLPRAKGNSFVLSKKDPILLSWQGGGLQLWDLTNGFQLRWEIQCEAPIASGMFSPDGDRIVIGEQDLLLEKRVALVLAVRDGSRVCPPLQHLDGVLHAEFSPDGKQVVTAGEEFASFVFDALSGEAISGPLKHQHQVRWASFSSDSRWVVTASRDKSIRVWEANSGDPITPPLWHEEGLNKAFFSKNNNYVAVQTENRRLVVWSLRQMPDVINYLEPFIALTTRNRLQNWQTSWARLQQFQSNRPARDLRGWHKERAQVCADKDNLFGQNFHLEFVAH